MIPNDIRQILADKMIAELQEEMDREFIESAVMGSRKVCYDVNIKAQVSYITDIISRITDLPCKAVQDYSMWEIHVDNVKTYSFHMEECVGKYYVLRRFDIPDTYKERHQRLEIQLSDYCSHEKMVELIRDKISAWGARPITTEV
jgi:hypothetical protein